MIWVTRPAFSNSIFTEDPTLPDDVQVIVGIVPRIQVSPPFGAVTVIAGGGVESATVIKFVMDLVELPLLFETVRLTE